VRTTVARRPTRADRSNQTRQALVMAARQVFNTTAFHAAKIADISALAGVAHGSFYTHFPSKHEVFLAVLDEVLGESFVRTAIRRELGRDLTPVEEIEAANRRFFAFYAEHARILASMEELAPTVPEIEERRYQSFMAYTYRTAAAIKRWQQRPAMVDDRQLETLAYCLGSAVERLAQLLFLFGAPSPNEEECLASLTSIWIRTLGLDERRDGRTDEEEGDRFRAVDE